jgi:nucleoid-associated protein YgaU
MKFVPWLVFVSWILTGCSGSKSSQKVSEETPQIEISETDEFADELNAPVADSGEAQAASEEATEIDSPSDEFASETVSEVEDNQETAQSNDNYVEASKPLSSESSLETPRNAPQFNPSGEVKQYSVQKNETLMMIAFKLYGDYGKWREIANMNQETLKGGSVVRTGMTLNYNAPSEEFVWNPQGNPYLIKTGDTLGSISTEVYSTSKKWKIIWENNRPLIKDPNKIYAGFTIFYPEDGREVASQK